MIGILSLFAVLAAFLALANVPPLTKCIGNIPASSKVYWFRAIQIQFQPWLGRHHVYATFVIPAKYKFDHLYTAKLMIEGVAEELPAGSPEDEDIYSGRAEPGYYFKSVQLSTRTALWLLLTGRFGDLRTPCHWRLVIADRVR